MPNAGSSAASSHSDPSDGWEVLGGCFVKDTMLRTPDGTLKMVSAFKEGDEVMSAPNGVLMRVASAQQFPRAMRDLVNIQTADAHLVVTFDHRIALARGLVKSAQDVQTGDVLLCGLREQTVTKVR